MDMILRAVAIYVVLLVMFRVAGKRSLASLTPFDLLLLLVIAEATQQALLGEDFSVTNGFVVIAALIAIDIVLSLLKDRFPRLERALDSAPLVIVEDGQPLRELMSKARVDEGDVLMAARQTQGLERMDQIKYAVLERSGGISVIPKA